MPAEIETALTKITRDFIWEDDSSPRIALATLYCPIEEGGLNLLDIRARNDAIEITWLRDYLNFSPSRPTWAKITNLILKAAAPPSTSTPALINSFLQSWNTPTRGRCLALLNNDTVRMLKAGRKYHTNLAAICLSSDLHGQLPAWYHLKAAAHPLTTRTAKCLLETHSVATVADLIATSARLRNNGQIIPHTYESQCLCNDCSNDRGNKCTHPHKCTADADAPPMWQHAWKCAEQRLRARSPTQRSGGPTCWQRGSARLSATATPSSSTSSDHAPSPPHRIAFKLGKNIEHGPYDGSPANQGAAAP